MITSVYPRCFLETILSDVDGNIIQRNPVVANQFIDPGRQQIADAMMGFTTSMPSGFIWVMAGSGTNSIDAIYDDRLGGNTNGSSSNNGKQYEYNGNSQRKNLQSVLYGGDITSADWQQVNFTYSGVLYTRKLQGYVIYGVGEPNVGPFQRYGLNTNNNTPTTVTGISGITLNEMIDSVPQNKTTSNVLTVNITIYV